MRVLGQHTAPEFGITFKWTLSPALCEWSAAWCCSSPWSWTTCDALHRTHIGDALSDWQSWRGFLWPSKACKMSVSFFFLNYIGTCLGINVLLTGQRFLQGRFFSLFSKFPLSCMISLFQNWEHPWIIIYSSYYSSWWSNSSGLAAAAGDEALVSVYLGLEAGSGLSVITWDSRCALRALCTGTFSVTWLAVEEFQVDVRFKAPKMIWVRPSNISGFSTWCFSWHGRGQYSSSRILVLYSAWNLWQPFDVF